jgi:DNA-binding response OmpR family regulator
VPASHHSSARTASQPSVLLLEQYDALAAAIGSALKKFAPHHATSVARTLAEAEKLAAKIQPELFMIDVDPPWIGISEFLEKMRDAYPTARVLIIGASIHAEIAAERGFFCGLQFIGKPFELAAFGAAVQAVLGPWHESEAAVARGTLRDLNSIEILLLHCTAGANVTINLAANAHRRGKIYIVGGQIAHAEAGELTGAEALREMLSWSKARASETKAAAPKQRTIERDWPGIIVQALREQKAAAPIRVAPVAQPPPKTKKTGKKIVVIDDTEMLLIFVEDVLATDDPQLQITTALSGTDGVKETERVLPDLVLLDFSLPDFNGDEVCKRLLQNERTARVPVLMMSGHIAEMNAVATKFENVVATIEKPFLSDALVQLVKKTLAAGPRAVVPKKKEQPIAPAAPTPPPKQAPPAKTPTLRSKQTTVPKAPAPPPQDQQSRIERTTSVTSALAPSEFEMQRRPEPAPPMQVAAAPAAPVVRVAPSEKTDAVLSLYLEVLSMQLTPELQMGAIRARPSSPIVSLQLSSAAAQSAIGQTGFQLGATSLDTNGRITALRLIPTSHLFQAAQTRAAFEIGGVAVIPNKMRARVQLTPAGTTPMTMEMLAHLELVAVELSPTFQVSQLILNSRANSVRVTLDPKAPHQSGANFEASSLKLDPEGRITELVLSPIR